MILRVQHFTVPSSETEHKGLHLNADHFLWDVHHGISQPALQAFGKVTNGLS